MIPARMCLESLDRRPELENDPTLRIGEIDWTGRISKCGDKMLRGYLFEAANVLLTRVAKWSALKAWGIRLAKRSGLRKAKVCSCTKACGHSASDVVDGTEFRCVKGDRHANSIAKLSNFPLTTAGIQGPCRTFGVGAIAPGFAMLKKQARFTH